MKTEQMFFPEMVQNLPEVKLPYKGARGWLIQGEGEQVLFMQFSEAVELKEHSHKAQWGVVLEGKIELIMDGTRHTFKKGDRYFIPEGTAHSGYIYAGYVDITYFNEKDRFEKIK